MFGGPEACFYEFTVLLNTSKRWLDHCSPGRECKCQVWGVIGVAYPNGCNGVFVPLFWPGAFQKAAQTSVSARGAVGHRVLTASCGGAEDKLHLIIGIILRHDPDVVF